MNNFVVAAAYILGAATGALLAHRYTKRQYEEIINEEIASVKEAYSVKKDEPSEENDEEPEKVTVNDMHKKVLDKYNAIYGKQSDIPEKVEIDDNLDKPYVIPPEEYGEFDDYICRGLVFYADQVLTDDEGNLVEDVDRVVGIKSLTHFGEYEDDAVHVRNDRLKCDYEILMDSRTYSDMLKTKPHHTQEV